jgi:hypothetical protein
MNNHSPVCPHCGQADKTYKISLLYLESTARLHHHETENQPELDSLLADFHAERGGQDVQNQLLNQFTHSFAPPMDEKSMVVKRGSRRIHPDSMVIFFSLLALLIVFQIATTQPVQLPAIVILVAGSLLAYILARKTIVKRYEANVRKEQEESARAEIAMTRWMNLYFCSRDKGVFDPDQNRFAPLEQISDLFNIA